MASRILAPAQAKSTIAAITQTAAFIVEPVTTNDTPFDGPETLSGFVQDDSTLATKTPQLDIENGVYVIERGEGSLLELQFFGVGAENETFNIRLEGWSQYRRRGAPGAPQDTIQWEPTILTTKTCTLGQSAGVAGGLIDSTMLWADQIADYLSGDRTINNGVRVAAPSSPDEAKVTLVVDPLSHQQIIVRITRDGGTADSAGLAYRWVTGV